MKFVDEYRDGSVAAHYVGQLRRAVTRPWTIMEICGGQTHAILKHGIDRLLPEAVTLVHGPGCPVCVTPLEALDQAHAIAARAEVIFCSFGDMLRVPGSDTDLLALKAGGADVRAVYSPLDALRLAQDNPERQVVFFAVGFETTAPANAMLVYQARELGLDNLSVLVSHVLVPPAVRAILGSPDNRVQGLLAAGHVCAVTGLSDYESIALECRLPIVVTGFEPADILQGLLFCVRQLESGSSRVENQYARAVPSEGNPAAQEMVRRVFCVSTRPWRGMGAIADSGLKLRPEYAGFDAASRFGVGKLRTEEPGVCISGEVLTGRKKPNECPAFGVQCLPERPLGAPMVSSEGACAAYYRYREPGSVK